MTMLFLLLLDDPVDDANGVYHVSLRGQQIMDCALEFQPSEVQTKSLHSFELRAHINALFVSYYHFAWEKEEDTAQRLLYSYLNNWVHNICSGDNLRCFVFARLHPMILSSLSASITRWLLLQRHQPSLLHLPPRT